MFIYHITSKNEWQQAHAKGEYLPANYSADGFIHCSKKEQVVRVANRAYTQQSGLMLLKIDTSLLSATVKEENLEGGSELFPHIYGPLPVKAVSTWVDFPCDTSGFTFPAKL